MTFQFYSGSFIELLPKKSCYNLYTQRIHVWCIYLHLAGFYGKCWQIYQSHGSYGIQHGSVFSPYHTTPPLRSSSPGSDLAFIAWIFWPWKQDQSTWDISSNTGWFYMDVSENRGIFPPNHPISIGFSIIFTIHFGVPLFSETSICQCLNMYINTWIFQFGCGSWMMFGVPKNTIL